MTALHAHQLGVAIGSIEPLKPTDLTLQTGQLTAILGPNGAGKSTLVKALLGLIAATGEVRLDEAPLTSLSPVARAKLMAYLPQGQSHAWPLSVEAVVTLGRHPHGGKDDGTVERVLTTLGLAERRMQSVLTLSGGEQMRVSLARALAVEAAFLFADEPLASLDPRYQFEIMTVLAKEAERSKGIVVVMHDLTLAARYADRIILMKDGSVVADGAPGDVLTPQQVESAFSVRTQTSRVRRADGGFVGVALPDGLA